MVERYSEEVGVGCSIHPRGTYFYGGYSVKVALESVELPERVQSPLATPDN